MTKELINEAYNRLTNKTLDHECELSYSGKFKGFNANASRLGKKLSFNLSRNWEYISNEIKIGLIQDLLIRIFRLKKEKTMNIDLYHNFLRNAHLAVPKTKKHPVLEESFNRNNAKFFNNTLETVNFKVSDSSRILGSYHYGSDTITITKHLLENQELLDFVMYHEMLHKHHKFSSNKCNTLHHSPEFKRDEQKFPSWQQLEKKLQSLSSRKSLKKTEQEGSSWLKRIFLPTQ